MYRLSPIMYIYRLGFLQSHPVTWGLRPIRLLNANSYPNKVDSRLVSGLLLRTPSTDPRYGTSRYRLKTINKDFTYGLSSRSPLSAKFRTLRGVNVIMSKSCFRRKEMPRPVDRESLNSRWFRKPLSQLFKIPSELFHSKTSIIRIFEIVWNLFRISAISKRNYLTVLKSSCTPYWSVLAQLTEKVIGTIVHA